MTSNAFTIGAIIFIFSFLITGCSGRNMVNCHRTFTINFQNSDTIAYQIKLSAIPKFRKESITILLDTLVVAAHSTNFTVIEYKSVQDQSCLYYKNEYASYLRVIASVYRDDSILVTGFDLYPWDINESDRVWVEGDGKSQYSDTIFLSELDSIHASKQ